MPQNAVCASVVEYMFNLGVEFGILYRSFSEFLLPNSAFIALPQQALALQSKGTSVMRICMQIALPEDLLLRLNQLAARRQQAVESILADRLFTALDDELDRLPTVEQAELRALHHLSDDVLRLIAAEQMRPEDRSRLAELMQRNSEGSLSQTERETLATLVECGDRLMLRKAETAAILVHRGYAEIAHGWY